MREYKVADAKGRNERAAVSPLRKEGDRTRPPKGGD